MVDMRLDQQHVCVRQNERQMLRQLAAIIIPEARANGRQMCCFRHVDPLKRPPRAGLAAPDRRDANHPLPSDLDHSQKL